MTAGSIRLKPVPQGVDALGFEAMPMALALLYDDHTVVTPNPALARLLDTDAARMAGKDLVEQLKAAANYADARDGAHTFSFGPDGDESWFRLELSPYGGGVLAMLVDVTAERRVLERARADFIARDRLLHDAEVGTWRYDPDQEIYYFTSELALGYENATEPCPLATLQMIQHRDDRPIDTAIRERITREGGTAEAEMRYRDGQGGWRHLRALYRSGQKLPSGRYEMYGISLNVTALARARDEANSNAEQLAAATASKSNFLASVSHEIRTPMNGIVGVLHLLRREELSAEGRDLLGEALSCSDMLSQLINDVLDFSKMEAGKLDIAPVPTDPVAVLDNVVSLLHPLADAKHLYLRYRADDMGWAEIDPVRLRQCLFNIIGNAVKFTEAGGVEVRMAYVGEGAARKLRCEVKDTGIGVPEDAKAALFDRFQQAESGAARKFGGTGLGLAISRSLSRMMGGDMGFDSEPGQGSTFWFEFLAPHAEARETAAAIEQTAAPLDGLRILIVDDNRTNRLVGLKSVEALGAEAETVDSGEAAIAAAARGGFDLILMDINMPGMDGMEATRRIRDLGSPEADVPVIALTADVMTHHQESYLAAGMNGFVPKPFAPAQLLAEVMRLANN